MNNHLATATTQHWLAQIERVCQGVEVQVHVLLDQADWVNAALPVLHVMTPPAPWYSLFTDTPEEQLLHSAPLLIRLDLSQPEHKTWLAELLTYCASDRLLVLISPWPFKDLCEALRALALVRRGGVEARLRFYDPRVFPWLMSSILTAEQRAEFSRVGCYWSWLDRDAKPQWLLGSANPEQGALNVAGLLELCDQQCEWVGCVSDAHQMLTGGRFDYLGGNREERFSKLYALCKQAGEEGCFGDLLDYVRGQI